jgi:hypothetical protein
VYGNTPSTKFAVSHPTIRCRLLPHGEAIEQAKELFEGPLSFGAARGLSPGSVTSRSKAASIGGPFVVFPARQMIFDVIGDLLADRHQRKQFGFNERIVGPLDKFPTLGRLIP